MTAPVRPCFTNLAAYAAVGVFACLSGGGCPLLTAAQSSQPTSRYGRATAVCRITDPKLNEASGLAASRRNAGLYYTHNDSQGQPHVYVLDRTGRIFATIRLVGAANVDWEDIALVPGSESGAWDVCVADIGDNDARRAEIAIYRFPEPDLSEAAGTTVDLTPVRYRCTYSDGPRDAEGFAVDPGSGAGYVFTKRWDGACRVYRLKGWQPTGVSTLERVAALKFPAWAVPVGRMVTAADISGDGRRLVVRSYLCGWEWRLPTTAGDADFEHIFEQMPAPITLAPEAQGEALCFSADQHALLTISENTPTTLYESRLIESGDRGKRMRKRTTVTIYLYPEVGDVRQPRLLR